MLQVRIHLKTIYLILLGVSLAFCNNEKAADPHTSHQEVKETIYTCPMHPEIHRNAPGPCPICKMDLVQKVEETKPIHKVELNALLKPTNEFVVSTIPVKTMIKNEEDIELKVLGSTAYDTRQIGTVSSRVSGRIERLYIRYKYQLIQSGQKVMDIYSPELNTAQQNLLFLLKNDPDNTSLITASEERLLLLGFNRQQINSLISSKKIKYSISVYSNYSGFVTDFNANPLNTGAMNVMASMAQELNIKEGMYLQKGQTVFSVYNADKIWILLNLFPEQQALIKVGSSVHIIPETAPQQQFRAKINYIEPIFREGSKTVTARVYFNNAALRLPIGSRVKATVFGNIKDASWLPQEAVLSLGREKIVFVKEAGGFRARLITSGLAVNNLVQVLKGISPTDSVAANAQYLVDNEVFIKIK